MQTPFNFHIEGATPSRFGMVNVSRKYPTERMALACGRINLFDAFEKLATQTLPKGDVLALAEVAGINAAKHAANALPLAHPLAH